MDKIILASASPRRQELLKQIGLDFKVAVRPVEETLEGDYSPQEAVCQLAFRKANAVARFETTGIIIGADTVVVHGQRILGKPVDASDAIRTLKSLSGTDHYVVTGFCVIDKSSGQVVKDSETTRVFFRNLTEAEITAYVNSGEPKDKAGSYGIQGLGAVLVEKIQGCYFNVVGLPLTRLTLVLNQFGVRVLV